MYALPQSRSWLHHKDPLLTTPTSLCLHHSPLPKSWPALIYPPFLKFYYFYYFKILCKWNLTVCNLWAWLFWLCIIIWKFVQVVAWIKQLLYFYWWIVFHDMHHSLLSHLPVEGYLADSSFLPLCSCTDYCANINFDFSGINAQRCNCWSYGGFMFSFLKTWNIFL